MPEGSFFLFFRLRGDFLEQNKISFRKPQIEDGPKIWDIVKHSGVLDLNSTYCYLILCKHFSNTCVVAEQKNELVGFVSAYIPPNSPDVLFIWQIGIIHALRGKGLGQSLILNLLQRPACQKISFIETTVSPNNAPSRALFTGLPQRLGTQFIEHPEFSEALFPKSDHAPEHLFRIGPFDPANIDKEVLTHENH